MKEYYKSGFFLLVTTLLFSNYLFSQTEFDLITVADNTPTNISETIAGVTMTVSTRNNGANNTLFLASSAFGTNGIAAHGSASQNSEEMIISFSEPVNVSDIVVNSTQTQSRTWTFTPTGGANAPVTETNTFNGSTTVSLNFTNVTQIDVTSNFLFSNAEQMVFDKITILGAVVPIELIAFEGQSFTDRIELNWKTASELNNEKFEIETSRNGKEFQKIGEINGNGTTDEQQAYSFNVENPIKGTSYYRLKQIDFDGQSEYSQVISLNFKGENREVGVFYPNPSNSGLINLDYFAQHDDKIRVSVYDMTGKLVLNQIQQVIKGNTNLSFDFQSLNTGIYIVEIRGNSNLSQQKIIIER